MCEYRHSILYSCDSTNARRPLTVECLIDVYLLHYKCVTSETLKAHGTVQSAFVSDDESGVGKIARAV